VAIVAYLVDFDVSALKAAEPACMEVVGRWDRASVSGEVTSHVTQRPRAQGIRDTPSGRFPSERQRPVGSFVDGICARCISC
jgi:hypothetical protein